MNFQDTILDYKFVYVIEINPKKIQEKNPNTKVIREPKENSDWAPGYYSILFEDPDGIRIEANFVPGKGNLDPNVLLPKKWEISY